MNIILIVSIVLVFTLSIITYYSSSHQMTDNKSDILTGIFASLLKSSLIFNVPLGVFCLLLFLINTLKEMNIISIDLNVHQLTYQAIYTFIFVGIIMPIISLLMGIQVSKTKI